MKAAVLILFFLMLTIFFVSGKVKSKRFRDCREERLKTKEEQFDVVLTGTVVKIDRTPNVPGGEYGAEIIIKRLIKGEDAMDYLTPKRVVRVEGFGSESICDNRVALRDTRIFLLNVMQPRNQLKLNGTLLRITVPNLERVTAVIKGEPYKRSVIIDELCEKKYCAFNGNCQVESGRAKCYCPTNCPIGYQPVCGSNSVTYPNECRLRVESCKKQLKVFVRHEGSCVSGSRFSE